MNRSEGKVRKEWWADAVVAGYVGVANNTRLISHGGGMEATAGELVGGWMKAGKMLYSVC